VKRGSSAAADRSVVARLIALPGAVLLTAIVPAVLYVLVAWPAVDENAATYDETEHVPAGYVYVTRADYRLAPGHPPLVKQLFALPLVPLRPVVSPAAERAFRAAAGDVGANWIFGHHLLYDDNAPAPLLRRARTVVVGLGAVLVVLIFLWAREVFGTAGGVFAATLAALDPNLLAHGTLATTDLGFTLFFFAALYAVRRVMLRLSLVTVLGAAIAIGAAVCAKHSAFLLVPIVLILGWARVRAPDAWPIGATGTLRGARARVVGLAAILLLWVAVSWGSLWAVYGFRWAGAADPSVRLPTIEWTQRIREMQVLGEYLRSGQALPDVAAFDAEVAARRPGLAERFITTAVDLRALPEAYLLGLAYAVAMAQIRPSYLLGQVSLTGWASYFPIAFAVKTPATTLVLLALACALATGRVWRRGRNAMDGGRSREAMTIVVPMTIVMVVAMVSRFNIGYRHILPMLPFAYVLLGGVPSELTRLLGARRTAVVVVGACVLLAAETLTARPFFLPFFNVVAERSRGGLDLLSDSNLDWGQALPALRRWMDDQHVTRMNLCYFGTADPAAYGLRVVPLAGSNVPNVVEVDGAGTIALPERPPELPGYVAISATHLQGTYLSPELREHYAFLRKKQPVAVPGRAIYVYWVERWGE
jgi:hypothetical protein